MPRIEVRRTYVEMLRPEDLAAAPIPDGVHVESLASCPPELYRWLYAEVGRAYSWIDRLGWSDREIRDHLARPGVAVSVLRSGEVRAGYFESVRHPDAAVEIAYFGLLPPFVGRGLGKAMLTLAVRDAWARGAARVWLHTCSLDHPAALGNYLRRGFRIVKQETYWADLPETAATSGS